MHNWFINRVNKGCFRKRINFDLLDWSSRPIFSFRNRNKICFGFGNDAKTIFDNIVRIDLHRVFKFLEYFLLISVDSKRSLRLEFYRS